MKQEQSLPLQGVIGVMLTIGGLWHAAAPWIFGYSWSCWQPLERQFERIAGGWELALG